MDHASGSPAVEAEGLAIAREFYDFVDDEALPGTGIDNATFWTNFSSIVHNLTPTNRALLARRAELQAELAAWYRDHGAPVDIADYESFLRIIGYLPPEGPDFSISTTDVDPEIASIAGAQLVVPVMNARYALNAANDRWGSLYDALNGTDAIPETDVADKGRGFNPKRG